MNNTSPIRIRLLDDSDLPALQIFCDECKELGLVNNQNFAALKLDQMKMPYGQFFIAVDDQNKIYSLAGVHQLPEVNDRAWRCLFRGAQLANYTPTWSMNIFKSGIHFAYFLYHQLKFIQLIDKHAEFYISTNIENTDAGVSSRLDKIMMPRLAKQGLCVKFRENFTLYYTQQNLWKINIDEYYRQRANYIE